jgi:hypothetical protein
LRFFLAPCSCTKGREQAPQNSASAAEQNLLIVTVMSFDRTGIIKHNHHVQIRAVFPPNSSQTLPGQAFLCFVCAKR